MPVIVTALMGFLAFSGSFIAPGTVSLATSTSASVATTTLALADAVALTPATADESDPITVKMTAYNAVPEQTDSNPDVTASGARSNPEVIAARSGDLAADLPFGTVIRVTGPTKDTEGCRFNEIAPLIGYRVIGDAMASRKREQVDILLDETDTVMVHGAEMNPAAALGLCHGVSVEVVGHINMKHIPTTQAALKKLVEGDKLAMR